MWTKVAEDSTDFCVGTIDPLYLLGPDHKEADVGDVGFKSGSVPKGGYGMLLAGGYGNHNWVSNEIHGVTDSLPVCGIGRGSRKNE